MGWSCGSAEAVGETVALAERETEEEADDVCEGEDVDAGERVPEREPLEVAVAEGDTVVVTEAVAVAEGDGAEHMNAFSETDAPRLLTPTVPATQSEQLEFTAFENQFAGQGTQEAVEPEPAKPKVAGHVQTRLAPEPVETKFAPHVQVVVGVNAVLATAVEPVTHAVQTGEMPDPNCQ